MHDCVACGSACYCDMDDCYLPPPLNCCHVCQEETDEPYMDDDDDHTTAPSPSADPEVNK